MVEPRTWVVGKTQPNRENFAAENIANQKFSYYLPRILEVIIRGGQKMFVSKPLFCGYIFVDSADRWRPLASTLGIASILMAGDGPAFLSNATIAEIKSREDSHGFVQLPKKGELQKGDRIRVKGGSFDGQIGVYAGMVAHDRSRVLLDFLGHKSKVLVASNSLATV